MARYSFGRSYNIFFVQQPASWPVSFFTDTMWFPSVLALIVILAELLGAVGLITDLFTRICAFSVGVCIAVGALMVDLPNGIFTNWFGKRAEESFEYHILVVGMAITLILTGRGRWPLDALILNEPEPTKQLF